MRGALFAPLVHFADLKPPEATPAMDEAAALELNCAQEALGTTGVFVESLGGSPVRIWHGTQGEGGARGVDIWVPRHAAQCDELWAWRSAHGMTAGLNDAGGGTARGDFHWRAARRLVFSEDVLSVPLLRCAAPAQRLGVSTLFRQSALIPATQRAEQKHGAVQAHQAPFVPPYAHGGWRKLSHGLAAALGRLGMPLMRKAAWPEGAPFALFLSHDVDQIYEREMFALLSQLNRLRRACGSAGAGGRERGWVGRSAHVWQQARRLWNMAVRPAVPLEAFKKIDHLEGQWGFRSTYFLLEDTTGGRYGGRYRFDESPVRAIAAFLRRRGHELALHGGFADLHNAVAYQQRARRFWECFDARPVGIRNHYLAFYGMPTWQAHGAAGFGYDATFGYNELPGCRAGVAMPFHVDVAAARGRVEGALAVGGGVSAGALIELPLTLMDTTIFHYLALGQQAVSHFCERVVDAVEQVGGLLGVLWHSNFFTSNQPPEWQLAYQHLLAAAARRRPWCATGEAIADWWRWRHQVKIELQRHRDDNSAWFLQVVWPAGQPWAGFAFDIFLPDGSWLVDVKGVAHRVEKFSDRQRVVLGRPLQGVAVQIEMRCVESSGAGNQGKRCRPGVKPTKV